MANTGEIVKVRESNMELLRIVSILFVTIHHFLTHGASPSIFDASASLTVADSIALFLNGFVYIGVNCFLLISGYFGIKYKMKSLVNLLLICVFYSVAGYLVHLYIDHQTLGISVMKSIFFLKYCNWWFVKCYIGLWLLAPILNKAIAHFTQREYQLSLLMLTIASVYLGNIQEVAFFDGGGYSILHFTYIYMIGGYIKRHVRIDEIRSYRGLILLIFIISASIWGGMSIAAHSYVMPYWQIPNYNNLFLMTASISFFCFFTTFVIRSKIINTIAMSAFPVYLAQEHIYIHRPLYGFVRRICSEIAPPPSSSGVLIAIILAIGFFIIVCMFDQSRIMLFGVCQRLYKKVIHE